MVMKFKLTPHTKAILGGRGMCKVEVVDGEKFYRLICSSPVCIFQTEKTTDEDFGRDILVKGYAICPRCNARTEYAEGLEWNDAKQKNVMKCKVCNRVVPRKKIVWTQEVVSKHHKTRHEYYHKECWDAKFIDLDDNETASHNGIIVTQKLLRILRWAGRV